MDADIICATLSGAGAKHLMDWYTCQGFVHAYSIVCFAIRDC